MDTIQALRARKSYRGTFLETPVPREDLMEMVEAGFLAPSGCNTQTTKFIAVDDPKLVRELAEIYGYDWAKTAPAAILVLSQKIQARNGAYYDVEDFAAAAENILLAVTAKGYATTWIQGQIDYEGKAERMAELLGIPEEMKVEIYLPIGIPAQETKAPKKLAFEERVWFNHYGSRE